MTYQIEAMQVNNWPQVQTIYAEGIATGLAAFAESAPEWDRWDEDHLEVCRFVARNKTEILGWAALSPVSSS